MPSVEPKRSRPSEIAENARRVSSILVRASRQQKDAALLHMAESLESHRQSILDANAADLRDATSAGLAGSLINRLRFSKAKIDSRQRSLRKIADLPDPVGQVIRSEERPGGLFVERKRVPLGVILMVYEARPHVTINAGAFCLKSGNAAILRGGSEAKRCNQLLGELWQDSLAAADLPRDAIQVVAGSHDEIRELLQFEQYIDLVIPRGGKGLIKAVAENSKIPVIKHYEGICHVYLDDLKDPEAAAAIVLDSKCLMPEVCNAMETLLVSRSASEGLSEILDVLRRSGVALRGCRQTCQIDPRVEPASENDWRTEYLDLTLSVRVVSGIDEAVDHINTLGSHHTDVIVTNDNEHAARFTERVDSAVVLVNASTMFCDGESLGMGAEIGISTDKLHARGPMGLEELTSYKFVIRGQGSVMGPPPATTS